MSRVWRWPCSSCRQSTRGAPPARAPAIARAALTPAASVVTQGIPWLTAARRISRPSVRAPDPVGVLTTRSTSPRSIQSTTCGEPSPILFRRVTGMPIRVIASAVPRVASDLKPVVVQDLGNRERAGLVGVGHADEGRALAGQRHAGGRLRLGEGRREVARDPHHLAGRAHLGPEQRVGALEAIERQHRLLDRDVLAVADSLLARGQLDVGDQLAEHDPAGELRQRHADGLGDEGHRARRARVRLDHVQLARMDRVLHVEQADDADRQRDLARRGAHLLEHLLAQRVRRQHAGAVAGVHAGLLDVLHDPADPHLVAVAQRIDVQLDGVLEEAVEEDLAVASPPRG